MDEFKERVQRKYVDSLVKQLKLRFPDVEQLESFNIFDPSRLPCDQTNIATHGNDELEKLCD